jgi:putative membrane protein
MHSFATTILANAWHDDGPGWWIVFVPLFWIVVIGGLIWVLRTRGPWGPPRAFAHRETALDALDRRYALGDIGVDEYRERRSVLQEQRAKPEH